MYNYFIGLDLGQAQDFTALSILEKVNQVTEKPSYHLRFLERPPLGTSYPDIVSRVCTIIAGLEGKVALVVDSTGVGRPIVDLLIQEKLNPLAVTITGGNTEVKEGNNYRVPKRNLVSNLQVLFQSGRLKVAAKLPDADIFVNEIINFKVKIDAKTAHDSYEAWREGVHDDLVLSVALAAWYAEKPELYSGLFEYYRRQQA